MKTNINDLAIFGGTPAFAETLHVGRPNIGDRRHFYDRLDDLLDRKWLTNDGPYVREFEDRIAKHLGVQHCIAVCNATSGLELTIKALGLTGEVIVPSFTFVATAHVLHWLGIDPVFVDVDPQSHALDPQRVEQAITPSTTGIIGVHLWGRPCAVDELSRLANQYGLHLLFDAAHAFSCTYKGQEIGNFGNAEVLSFHATKFVNAFEGGAIATNDEDLAARTRLMRNFGFADFDSVVSQGINAKMNEASAAMGLTSLDGLEEFRSANRHNYEIYRTEIEGMIGIKLLEYDESESCNYQYIVVDVDKELVGLSRNVLQAILWQEGVLARRYFYPGCHRMEPYRTLTPSAGQRLSNTEHLVERVLVLPTGTTVHPLVVSHVCGLLRFILDHSKEIAGRLRSCYPEFPPVT